LPDMIAVRGGSRCKCFWGVDGRLIDATLELIEQRDAEV
jgi:hypothetical protein